MSKDLNIGESTPKESFTNAYVTEIYESEHLLSATKRLRVILDDKYESSNLHKVMETQCQHLTMSKLNDLMKLLHKFKELFGGTLGTWKIDPVDFKFKRCKASMLATIPSTEGTEVNVQ